MNSTLLKYLRYQKHLSQEKAAKLFNLSRSSYEAYENGRRMPDLCTLIKIANFFEIPFFQLLVAHGLEKEMWKQILIIQGTCYKSLSTQ
ncbi:MAG: helix-turn-helix domain-containing protein [Streptococcaceae bacterium]|nr:helix-turn-helix domain-containing protein [Streptococcaceae bacterium]